MIDLILTAVISGAFYAGFKTGNKFKTLKGAAGGPIIEREQISVDNFKGHPCAAFMGTHAKYEFRQWAPEGQILLAAMRCYVASKLGEEVEVPDELLEP